MTASAVDGVQYAVPDLKFPEGPRWNDGRFWVSDQWGARVLALSEDGAYDVVATLSRPSGIGFVDGGDLLVARMDYPQILRISKNGRILEAVNLGSFGVHLNDMVVDRSGRIYVDAYPEDGDSMGGSSLIFAKLGEGPRIVADGLFYPNGLAVTPDGRTLIVSETKGERVTAFTISEDGSLSDQRCWAALPGRGPDGLCLDAEGAAWVSCYSSGEALRVREGGQVVDSITVPDRWIMSCALGGADGRSLLLCMAAIAPGGYAKGESVGYLETRRVKVPGIACP